MMDKYPTTLCFCKLQVMCKLYFFVQVASYTASLLLLTLISVERYFAIIHPILSKRVTGMGIMRGAVVVVWIVSIAYSTPSLFSQHISLTVPELIPGTNTSHNVTYEFCHDSTIVDVKIFVLVNFVLMYLIPLILMSVVYTRISVLLWQTSNLGAGGEGMLRANSSNGSLPMNRIRSTVQSSSTKHYHGYNHKQYADPAQKSLIRTNSKTNTYCDVTEVTVEEDLSPNSDDQSPARPAPLNMQDHGPVVIQKRAPNGIRKDASKKSSKKSPRSSNPFIARRKVIRLLIAIVISFAICVLPHHIRLLVHIWFRTEKSRVDNIMVPVTFLIFYFNSCLNPFLYAFLSDNFRKAFCELVWFKCFKSRARKGSALYVTNRTVPYTVPTVALRHDQDKVTNC